MSHNRSYVPFLDFNINLDHYEIFLRSVQTAQFKSNSTVAEKPAAPYMAASSSSCQKLIIFQSVSSLGARVIEFAGYLLGDLT